jgi:hypothetical protein
MQFQWNFTGLICSSSSFAYCTGFPVEWFLAELWPFDKRCFFSVLPDTQKLVRTTPHKLLVQFYPNFTGIISTKSSCALSVCHKICSNMKLAIMRRHMWLLTALVITLGPYAAFNGMARKCHIDGSMITAVWTHLRMFLNSKFYYFMLNVEFCLSRC